MKNESSTKRQMNSLARGTGDDTDVFPLPGKFLSKETYLSH